MQIPIIKIGNSKGIRIPKAILELSDIEDSVELEITNGQIILKAPSQFRKNWKQEFQKMHAEGEDKLEMEFSNDFDNQEWEW